MKIQNKIGTFCVLATAIALASCGGAETTTEAETEASDVAEVATEEAPEVAINSPVETAPADLVRGPGGLEEKCLSRVTEETGGAGTSTNHIEESEAAIEIYVNVDGATAPWKCLGYSDGSIAEVYFTGSEGGL